MTRERTVLLLIVALFAVGMVYHASRPSLCEPLRAGKVEVWLYRIHSGMTAAERFCIPWKGKPVQPLTTPIAFEEWFTSVGGPVRSRYAIAPDGTGYVQHDRESAGKLPAGFDAEGKFHFRDRRAYATINGLLAPLHDYSLSPGRVAQRQIPCRKTGNYSTFRVFWSGDFAQDGDVSKFQLAQDSCPALRDAMRRMNRARRILELKADPSLREWLLRGPYASKQAIH